MWKFIDKFFWVKFYFIVFISWVILFFVVVFVWVLLKEVVEEYKIFISVREGILVLVDLIKKWIW